MLTKFITKLKLFKHAFVKSLISGSYYNDVIAAPFRFTLIYFLLICFTLTLLITARMGLTFFFGGTYAQINELLTHPFKYYPKSLEVEIKNGKLTINQKSPYFVAAPQFLHEDLKKVSQDPNKFLVIDTKANPEAIKKHGSLVMITSDGVVLLDNQGREPALQVFDKNLNLTLNVKSLQKIVDQFKQNFPIMIAGLVASMIVMTFVNNVIAYALLVLVHSVPVVIIARIMKIKLPLLKYLQITFHLFTFVYLAIAISWLIGIGIDMFWYSVVVGAYAILVFKELKKEKLFFKISDEVK